MADYEHSSQEDVTQDGGDKAVKVWSFDLQTHNIKQIPSLHVKPQC